MDTTRHTGRDCRTGAEASPGRDEARGPRLLSELPVDQVRERLLHVIHAIRACEDDPAWQAALALARDGVTHAVGARRALNAMEAGFDQWRGLRGEAGEVLTAWLEGNHSMLEEQLARADHMAKAGFYPHLRRLVRFLWVRDPTIDGYGDIHSPRVAVFVLLIAWLSHDKVPSSDLVREVARTDLSTIYAQLLHAWPHPGRPRKILDVPDPPQPHKPRVDLALAQQAYEMDRDGAHWTDIAHRLWPGQPIPKTPKQRDALRKRVDRLIHRGQLLAEP